MSGAKSPEVRAAVLRLMRLVAEVEPGSVAHWDQRTSGNDARAALSMAAGANPDDVHPTFGTWDGPPAAPVQLTMEMAA